MTNCFCSKYNLRRLWIVQQAFLALQQNHRVTHLIIELQNKFFHLLRCNISDLMSTLRSKLFYVQCYVILGALNYLILWKLLTYLNQIDYSDK